MSPTLRLMEEYSPAYLTVKKMNKANPKAALKIRANASPVLQYVSASLCQIVKLLAAAVTVLEAARANASAHWEERPQKTAKKCVPVPQILT